MIAKLYFFMIKKNTLGEPPSFKTISEVKIEYELFPF